jgi:hypothetical protein
MFVSDKQELLAKIEKVEWGPNAGRMLTDEELNPVYESQISIIDYAIKALSPMPGRKELVLITAQPQLGGGVAGSPGDTFRYESTYGPQFSDRADKALRAGVVIHMLDIRGLEAMGASSMASGAMNNVGVVDASRNSPIGLTPSVMSTSSGAFLSGGYGMGGGFGGMGGGIGGGMGGGGNTVAAGSGYSGMGGAGTEAGQNAAPLNSMSQGPSRIGGGMGMGAMGMGMNSGMFRGYNPDRNTQRLVSMPEKTGGLFVENKNFFVKGLGGVEEHLKGYYLLSYEPPPNTFSSDRTNAKYHKIGVVLNRKGLDVHTRDGFFGYTGSDAQQTSADIPNAMRDAIFAPFLATDVRVNLAAGFVNFPQQGYMIRAWVHVDAKDLQIVKREEGNFISLQTVCVASDMTGTIREGNLQKFDFSIKDENIASVKEDGLRFSLLLSMQKPGAYYLHVLVKDQSTERVGSAREFMTIPDLKKGRLALSNLFIVNSKEDQSWVWSGGGYDQNKQVLVPVLQSQKDVKTPALRDYRPGDDLDYMTIVYNGGKREAPDLESQFFLYREGVQLLKGDPQPVDISGVKDFTRIPIRKTMKLGTGLQEGNYVLQLVVRDKQDSSKKGLVAQALNFVVKAQ